MKQTQVPICHSESYREIGKENTEHRIQVNMKADPERTERRRRLEALLEAKRLKSLDQVDSDWADIWSM